MLNLNLEMYETTEFQFKNSLAVEQSVTLKTSYELNLSYNIPSVSHYLTFKLAKNLSKLPICQFY